MTPLDEGSPYEIIARFQQPPKAPPVDVEGIATALGINVFRTNLGPTISGSLMRNHPRKGVSGFSILVNSIDAPTRQRFTIAHELAHYILHRDLIETGVTDDTMYRSAELKDYLETQADKTAADILMPVRLVKNWAVRRNRISLLAAAFDVSPQSMGIRLRGIGMKLSP